MAVAADGRFLYISETVSIYLGLSQVSFFFLFLLRVGGKKLRDLKFALSRDAQAFFFSLIYLAHESCGKISLE